MKSLFLAWQAPKDSDRSRAWFPIGRLDAESSGSEVIEVTVVKVNHLHAPLNQSLLVEYTGKAPANHRLMSSPDFTPLIG